MTTSKDYERQRQAEHDEAVAAGNNPNHFEAYGCAAAADDPVTVIVTIKMSVKGMGAKIEGATFSTPRSLNDMDTDHVLEIIHDYLNL